MAKENITTVKTFSVKTEQEEVDRFDLLHEKLGLSTKGETFTAILDRFELPQKISDKTSDLQQVIDKLTTQVNELQSENKKLQKQLDEKNIELDTVSARDTENGNHYQKHLLELQNEIEALQQQNTLPKNVVAIHFTEDNLKALDFVCNRESEKRKESWSRSHVINHFVYSRFVKGDLNGDLASISDSDCKKMGITKKTSKEPLTI